VSFDSTESPGERLADGTAGAATAGVGLVSLIDPELSMTGVAFKPKCLGIHSSMSENGSTPIRVSGPSQSRIAGPIIEASLIYPRR
jgi:hypothetical protein